MSECVFAARTGLQKNAPGTTREFAARAFAVVTDAHEVEIDDVVDVEETDAAQATRPDTDTRNGMARRMKLPGRTA
jgi:hypothetical protein